MANRNLIKEYLGEAVAILHGRLIDNCYIVISAAKAKEIAAENVLPKPGYERKADFGKFTGWVLETFVDNKTVWSIRVRLPQEIVFDNFFRSR